jgi:hypothetical protein
MNELMKFFIQQINNTILKYYKYMILFHTIEDSSECDQTFQTMLRQFKLCPGFSDNVQNVKTLSRFFKIWSIHNFFAVSIELLDLMM